ncbi:MAG: DNA methyltransferase [Nanoarchaeota archaeon]
MAKKLNRKYIGFEISKEYCDIAKERLKRTDAPLKV